MDGWMDGWMPSWTSCFYQGFLLLPYFVERLSSVRPGPTNKRTHWNGMEWNVCIEFVVKTRYEVVVDRELTAVRKLTENKRRNHHGSHIMTSEPYRARPTRTIQHMKHLIVFILRCLVESYFLEGPCVLAG